MSSLTYLSRLTHTEYLGVAPRQTVGETTAEYIQRIARVTIPILTLYKPIGVPLTVCLNLYRGGRAVLNIAHNLHELYNQQHIQAALTNIVFSSTIVATFFYSVPAGCLLLNCQDAVLAIGNAIKKIQQAPNSEEYFLCALTIGSSLLQLCLLCVAAKELIFLAYFTRILLEFASAYTAVKDGNKIEAIAHLLMGICMGWLSWDYFNHKEKTLQGAVIVNESTGYFQLSDHSQFIVKELLPKSQNGTEIPSNRLHSTLQNWDNGTAIEVLPKNTLELDSISNTRDFQNATHILRNKTNDNVLLGTFTQASEFLQQLYRDSYKTGCNAIKALRQEEKLDIFDRGYNEGCEDTLNLLETLGVFEVFKNAFNPHQADTPVNQ